MRKYLVPLFLFSFLAGFFLSFGSSKALGAEERKSEISVGEDQFNYALLLFEQEKYLLSATEFGKIIEFYPASPYIPEAQYRMALSYYNEGAYREADNQLKLFLMNFPSNKYVEDALAKREILYKKLTSTESSINGYLKQPLFKSDKPVNGAPDTIRAVQVAIFEGHTYQEVEGEIKVLKEEGYDTLILRVFHNMGDRPYPFVSDPKPSGVYFKTAHAPVIEDVLGEITEIAHKHDLKIFAWMTTRYADYGVEGEEDLRCKAYYFRTRSIGNCQGLDLFNEKTVAHLEKIYQDLSAYPIDGVLFQDDLVLRHNEGFGEAAQRLYLKEHGKVFTPYKLYTDVHPLANGKYRVKYSKDFWEWSSWKNKRLLRVAKRLMNVVKENNPDVKFAINLMYESISNPRGALAWLSQSLDEALSADFDLYAFMAYHRQIQDELDMTYGDVIKFVATMTREAKKKINPSDKVLMKVQIVDWDTSVVLPPEEIDEVVEGILQEGGISIALVPYAGQQHLKKLSRSDF